MTAKGALVCHKSGESAGGLRPPVGSDRKGAHEQPLCWIRQGAREHNLLAGRDVQKVWEAGALCRKSRGETQKEGPVQAARPRQRLPSPLGCLCGLTL